MRIRRTAVTLAAVLAAGGAAAPVQAGDNGPRDVHPNLRPDLVAFYDFDHPVPGDSTRSAWPVC